MVSSVDAPAYQSRHVDFLCFLVLRSSVARDYVLSQNWRDVIKDIPGAGLLEQVLKAKIDPDNPASIQGFLALLPKEQEEFFSTQLYRKVPSNVAEMVPQWWAGLQVVGLKRHLQAAETRIKSGDITPGEIVNVQKEIVGLREQIDSLGSSANRNGT
jgi:DNA primase